MVPDESCELCVLDSGRFRLGKKWFKLSTCVFCKTPLVVALEHRPEFDEKEKELLTIFFSFFQLEWDLKHQEGHAHCHVMEK